MHAAMVIGNNTVMANVLDTVTLSCEMFGYFPEDLPEFEWRIGNVDIDSTYPLYNISTSRGTRLIQNGGSDSIPSVISTLRIFIADESVFGSYICQAQGLFHVILLEGGK